MTAKTLRVVFLACATASSAAFMTAGATNTDFLGINDGAAIDTCDDTRCIEPFTPADEPQGQLVICKDPISCLDR